jgi:hypothetical protein
VEVVMRCKMALAEISKLGRREELGLNPLLSEHVRKCPRCSKEWERQAALLDLLASEGPLPQFNDIVPRVMSRLGERPAARVRSWQWAAAAAIAVAALLLGYFLGLRGSSLKENGGGAVAVYQEALSGMPSGSVELAALEPYNNGAVTYAAETKR